MTLPLLPKISLPQQLCDSRYLRTIDNILEILDQAHTSLLPQETQQDLRICLTLHFTGPHDQLFGLRIQDASLPEALRQITTAMTRLQRLRRRLFVGQCLLGLSITFLLYWLCAPSF